MVFDSLELCVCLLVDVGCLFCFCIFDLYYVTFFSNVLFFWFGSLGKRSRHFPFGAPRSMAITAHLEANKRLSSQWKWGIAPSFSFQGSGGIPKGVDMFGTFSKEFLGVFQSLFCCLSDLLGVFQKAFWSGVCLLF